MSWSLASRRSAAFTTTAEGKIRAAQTPESVVDLRLELETAYLLL